MINPRLFLVGLPIDATAEIRKEVKHRQRLKQLKFMKAVLRAFMVMNMATSILDLDNEPAATVADLELKKKKNKPEEEEEDNLKKQQKQQHKN